MGLHFHFRFVVRDFHGADVARRIGGHGHRAVARAIFRRIDNDALQVAVVVAVVVFVHELGFFLTRLQVHAHMQTARDALSGQNLLPLVGGYKFRHTLRRCG